MYSYKFIYVAIGLFGNDRLMNSRHVHKISRNSNFLTFDVKYYMYYALDDFFSNFIV